MKVLAIIPARMGSSRFPGKPLAKILGKPMIGHVYNRVVKSQLLTHVVVATCDNEILNYIQSIGGCAVMTSKDHVRASDRCAEALLKIEKEKNILFDIVLMVQGDEPMTVAEMIDEAIIPMISDSSILVTNLMSEITKIDEFNDRNCIKVVFDKHHNAVYFSREPIPNKNSDPKAKIWKQVCVIPFRRDFLLEYTSMPPTPLEIAESIDMLRIIENDKKIRMVETQYKSFAVDTPEDLIRVEKLMSN